MAAAPSRIRWDRVGRWALICVFAFVIYLYIGPARTWVTTYAEAKRKRDDVASLRAQNERLRERRHRLKRARARSSSRRASSAWSRRARSSTWSSE